jgi:four helix bundle protein
MKKFEDIEVWQEARKLNKEIYLITNSELFAKDFGLRDQIRRASISVSSNIAEGFERDGNKEFIQFLHIAKGSIGEVRSQLYLAYDIEYIDSDTFNFLKSKCETISKQLKGFINYLKTSEYKGQKYSKN